MNTKKIMDANIKEKENSLTTVETNSNKLTSDSLFLIQDLLNRERNNLDLFKFQVSSNMADVKLSEQIKVYNNIDKQIYKLDKACREINSCFEGQFPKTNKSTTA